jgi:hypothetical protein
LQIGRFFRGAARRAELSGQAHGSCENERLVAQLAAP